MHTCQSRTEILNNKLEGNHGLVTVNPASVQRSESAGDNEPRSQLGNRGTLTTKSLTRLDDRGSDGRAETH
eukprot:465129-Hanusia_phi.AAC.1